MGMLMEKLFVDPSSHRDEILKINIPLNLSSQHDHPNKDQGIASTSHDSINRGSLTSTSSLGVRKLPSDPKYHT
ncbi:hypothetical protein UPYG_G00026280 [Umbra pygmaea]|uniref:Uncharacterized protein n=1 Tax=Umbra pygmaea TaxID=75934 RepID=A0ABD0XM00_UMBPY